MRRYLFAMAFLLYICVDRALQGLGGALYFDSGWEMLLIWLVAIGFLVLCGAMVWGDRQQRVLLSRAPGPLTMAGMIGYIGLLCLFTACLLFGLATMQNWWQLAMVDNWFKGLYAVVLIGFWMVAGRWWQDSWVNLMAWRGQNIACEKGASR